jgi:hypothetical protein
MKNQVNTKQPIKSPIDVQERNALKFQQFKLETIEEFFKQNQFYLALTLLDDFDSQCFNRASFALRLKLTRLIMNRFNPENISSSDMEYAPLLHFELEENFPEAMLTDANKAFKLYQIFYGLDLLEFAMYFLTRAANLNHALAQSKLGMYYYYGRFFDKDDKMAFKWLKLAAEYDICLAQNNLGYFYFEGIGTEVNYELAYKYLYEAYEQGETISFGELGFMLFHGRGVDKDIDKALDFWNRGKAIKDDHCIEYLYKYVDSNKLS